MALPCKFGNGNCTQDVSGTFVFANVNPKNPLADPNSIAMVPAITVCNQNIRGYRCVIGSVGGFASSGFNTGYNLNRSSGTLKG